MKLVLVNFFFGRMFSILDIIINVSALIDIC